MNKLKWAQEIAAPVRPLSELLAKYAQLLRMHERLLGRLDALCERQRELCASMPEELS